MLGKQGWSLLTNNNSLVARVFKARFYPHSSFLDAESGANPSYVWRSVLEAKVVVRMGARWRVGVSLSIPVLNQPWLPCKEHSYVTSSHVALHDGKVNNLLKVGSLERDEKVLHDLFVQRDIDLICCIPLYSSSVEDDWYWMLETHGDYSVKSTYRALQVNNGRWNTQDNSGFWKMFWNLKLPPKVNNFLWRGLTNYLPTLVSLRSKKVHVSGLCSMCNREDETIFHIMVGCAFTKSCLDMGLGGTVGGGEAAVFGSWFDNVCKGQSVDRIERLALLLWGVWGARNDLVWTNKVLSIERVVNAAITYLDSWKKAQLESRVVSPISGLNTSGCEQWAKPCFGEIKVNCDVAVFEDDNSLGLGWIARDHNGLFIDALAVKTYGQPDPFLAEAMALKEALSWVKGRWVEGSSLLFPFSINFVKRSRNQAVNFLARSSGSIPGCVSRGG
ncbi:hypothetical protein CsatA_018120 [Cannabis sativa]